MIFRAFHERLVAYAAGFVTEDSDSAGDLVQDAFVRIWEGRARLDPERSFRGLLYQTVRNLALNRSRDVRNRAALMAERYEPPGRAPAPPDAELEATLLAARLEEWIDGLPPRQREALRLSRFDGLDHREIADVMGCSPRTVNNHLVQALRTLRGRFAAVAPDGTTA